MVQYEQGETFPAGTLVGDQFRNYRSAELITVTLANAPSGVNAWGALFSTKNEKKKKPPLSTNTRKTPPPHINSKRPHS